MQYQIIFRSFTLVFVLQTFVSCYAVNVQCDFKFENWAVIERVYECKLHDLEITLKNQTIGRVSGDHAKDNNHNTVHALHIFGQKCFYFPQNFRNFFGNLEGLLIAYCGLKRISNTELQQFPKLQILLMPNNHLEVLEKDLFKFNPRIKALVLNHNKIKHIAHGILSPMKSLAKIFLYKNYCIDNVAVNPIQMDELVTEMIEHCPPERIQVHQPVPKTETQLKFEEIEGKMMELEKKMMKKFDILFQQLKTIEKLLALKHESDISSDPLILSTNYS